MFNLFYGTLEHKDTQKIIGIISIKVGGSYSSILTNVPQLNEVQGLEP